LGATEMTDPKSPILDLGVRCAQVDGQWHMIDVMPSLEFAEDQVGAAGVQIDILTTAIKWLAAKYLIKLSVESGVVH